MSRSQVQFSYGTSIQIAAYTGVAREIIVDTTLQELVLTDGSTVGGKRMASQAYVQSYVAANAGGGGGGGGGAFFQWLTCK